MYVISKPNFSKARHVLYTDGCSIIVVIICFPRFWCSKATPFIARLFPSVPLAVNIISSGKTRNIFAACFFSS